VNTFVRRRVIQHGLPSLVDVTKCYFSGVLMWSILMSRLQWFFDETLRITVDSSSRAE